MLALAFACAMSACEGESRLSLFEPNEAPAPELRDEAGAAGGPSYEPEVNPPSPPSDIELGTSALALRYDFEGEGAVVEDRVGGRDAVLRGDALLDSYGGVELDGYDDYVDLPNGVLSGYTSATIMAWLDWHGGYCWQRIFDFGNSDAGEGSVGNATTSLFLTPASCPSQVVLSMTERKGEQQSTRASRGMPIDQRVQVALVVDGEEGLVSLYIDGRLEATSPHVHALSQLEDVNNWLGRSQWVQDGNLFARYDELRIYDRALNGDTVRLLEERGPDRP
jgi:hypothetical protein